MKTKTPDSLTVLLADDDQDDRVFFERSLGSVTAAHQLITVTNGAELMDYLFKQLKHLPDVLFLDLNMPRKNGHECLNEIKSDERLKQIPVVIYSTSLSNELANTLYERGAHYYLQKCNFAELPKCIQKVLDLLSKSSAQPPRDKFIIQN